MAKMPGKGSPVGQILLFVFIILVLHIILAYLIAVCTNYLLIKYDFRKEDFFQVNTIAHSFASVIDIILIGVILKYFL